MSIIIVELNELACESSLAFFTTTEATLVITMRHNHLLIAALQNIVVQLCRLWEAVFEPVL